jgi:hypothetical protein
VTLRVAVTSNNVDETLADAEHAATTANLGPIRCRTFRAGNIGFRHTPFSRVRRICCLRGLNRVADFACS